MLLILGTLLLTKLLPQLRKVPSGYEETIIIYY